MKLNLCKKDEDLFIQMEKQHNLFLEGNLLKVIDVDGASNEFKEYIQRAKEADTLARKKRLELTKKVQEQNKTLREQSKEKEELLIKAQNAKEKALNDLDVLQKKKQFELINTIVNYALYVIVGTGVITTILYGAAIFLQSKETTLIGNTWSNLFGILLTNSFSIIGTIMGVKYANNSEKKNEN
jgi:hypothetical protein